MALVTSCIHVHGAGPLGRISKYWLTSIRHRHRNLFGLLEFLRYEIQLLYRVSLIPATSPFPSRQAIPSRTTWERRLIWSIVRAEAVRRCGGVVWRGVVWRGVQVRSVGRVYVAAVAGRGVALRSVARPGGRAQHFSTSQSTTRRPLPPLHLLLGTVLPAPETVVDGTSFTQWFYCGT